MDRHEFLLEQWKLASELHRHMDDMIWRRFDYFVVLSTALLTGYGYVWSQQKCAFIMFSGSVVVPLLGVALSVSWAAIHKRAQLYHSLRKLQAERAEKALTERLDPEQSTVSGDEQPRMVYGVKPEDFPEEIMDSVPHSAWGRTHTLDVVFGVGLGAGALWGILLFVSVIVLYLECC